MLDDGDKLFVLIILLYVGYLLVTGQPLIKEPVFRVEIVKESR
jgi:hypothetical protein